MQRVGEFTRRAGEAHWCAVGAERRHEQCLAHELRGCRGHADPGRLSDHGLCQAGEQHQASRDDAEQGEGRSRHERAERATSQNVEDTG